MTRLNKLEIAGRYLPRDDHMRLSFSSSPDAWVPCKIVGETYSLLTPYLRRNAAERGTMNETINLLAFAIQDKNMTRLEAQRIARTMLRSLAPGDQIGRGLVVEMQTSPAAHSDVHVTLQQTAPTSSVV